MLIDFFLGLKQAGLPVSVKEYLMLCEALQKGLAYGSVDEFYYLSRASLIKDETHFDRFDRAFATYFKGVEALDAALAKVTKQDIPEEWLNKRSASFLSHSSGISCLVSFANAVSSASTPLKYVANARSKRSKCASSLIRLALDK